MADDMYNGDTDGERLYDARTLLGLSQLDMGRAIGYKGKGRNVRKQVDRMELNQKPVMPKTKRAVNDLLKAEGLGGEFDVDDAPESGKLGPSYAHIDLQTGDYTTGATADIVAGLPIFENKILKVQRAMGGMDGVLIYDEGRSIRYECHDAEFMPHIIEQLNGLYKAYWLASFDGDVITKHRDASLAEQF